MQQGMGGLYKEEWHMGVVIFYSWVATGVFYQIPGMVLLLDKEGKLCLLTPNTQMEEAALPRKGEIVYVRALCDWKLLPLIQLQSSIQRFKMAAHSEQNVNSVPFLPLKCSVSIHETG